MIKSQQYIAVLCILLIGTQLLDAKEIKGGKSKAAVAQSKVAAGCQNTSAQFDLAINNVRARVLNGGDLWWNYNDQQPYYEVPSGSGKTSIYAGALWVAGYDADNNLRVAAQTYRQTGSNDFWAGPISKSANGTIDVTPSVCNAYDRFWVTQKLDIEKFASTGDGGSSAEAINSWPGNGNVANGEMQTLAPFFDADGNGVYEPSKGDYPKYKLTGDYPLDTCGQANCNEYLFGDKNIWWIFNDVGNIHTETNSLKNIGLEIRAQAFAFSTTDEVNNMTFYKYQVINRSSDVLLESYFGQWCDPDLGDATDDYVGCDVGLGLGFCYNSDAFDATASGYGDNPPAVGIDFFQGPFADPNDGIDNNRNGVIDECGEQIIMSKFIQYENTNNTYNGNPFYTDDYYQYLDGKWTNGIQITYGGNGNGGGTGGTTTPCNFMYPGNTDPAFPSTPWTMGGAGLPGADMRFIQSAGKFTLQPGGVNYVTTGVVWAQSIGGGPQGSVTLMKIADAKAQALFDACFNVLAGPDAPDIAIRELDQELILTLTNTSNKKVEGYNEIDVTIPASVPSDTNPAFSVPLTDAERRYKFEGYRIYQVVDANVKVSDLDDETKAKVIAEYDVNNGIGVIINYIFDNVIQLWVPKQETFSTPRNGNLDKGLQHSIKITKDLFQGGTIVNYRPYYFMAVSYAYNNFRPFKIDNALFTQDNPYFLGSKNTRTYSAIPSKPVVNNMGMILNSQYMDNLDASIKRIEGQGNGGNVLDFASGVEEEILASPDFRAVAPVYQVGKGPVKLKVIDPVKIKSGAFSLAFDGVVDSSNIHVFDEPGHIAIDSTIIGIGVLGDHYVDAKGYSISATLTPEASQPGATNNGFLEATMAFTGANWLTGVKDDNAVADHDWIKSGTFAGDDGGVYEHVLDGTWAPYILAGTDAGGVKPNIPFLKPGTSNSLKYEYLNGVDLVITNDKSKWTRSVVYNTANSAFTIRNAASKDRDGNTGTPEANQIGATGMSWFPGYAINVETGERLNIAFGENQNDTLNNGADMWWNPTGKDSATVYGGRHFIYIFNHIEDTSFVGTTNDLYMPKYDNSQQLYTYAQSFANYKNYMRSCIWVSMPLLASGQSLRASDVRMRFRVAKAYKTFVSANVSGTVNNGNPYYEYSVSGNQPASINQTEKAKSALDLISVVPNPYYAYSSYEKTIRDQLDNRVRFINLPSNCTVSIYNLAGTLIRTLKRSVVADVSDGYGVEPGAEDKNLSSTLDWDLNNTAGIKVSSGIYIIHVDAGVLGEKVIKWFGIMRPIDLDSF